MDLLARRQNNIVVSEAAVPASPPTTSARIFVDYRLGMSAMPGRTGFGSVDINTGVAIVNRGSSITNVTYALRNRTGAPVTTSHGTVAGGGHFAKFIDQLKDVAPDFNIPGDFPFASLVRPDSATSLSRTKSRPALTATRRSSKPPAE